MKLDFELVPDSVWQSNLRSILKPALWDFIRKDAYSRANGRCMICGKETTRFEAHEKWSYDEKTCVQKLEDVIAICKDCHSVIHIGFTELKGDIDRAIDHFIAVNECSYSDYIKARGIANEIHIRRNKVMEWKLDLSYFEKYIK